MCLPPQSYVTPDVVGIGMWVSRHDKLSYERRARLTAGTGELLRLLTLCGADSMHSLLDAYAAIHGADPSRTYVTASGVPLGQWHSDWSSRAHREPSSYQEHVWSTKCEMVRAYVLAHGQMPTFRYTTPDGVRLGMWTDKQHRFRHSMSPSRTAQLESIPGWRWRRCVNVDRSEDAWPHMCQLVEQYVRDHNELPLQRYKTPDGVRLGLWVSRQRLRFAVQTAARRARLEAIPGWTWQVQHKRLPLAKNRTEAWDMMLALVEKHVREHGQLPPSNYVTPDGVSIGRWVRWQRYRRNKLSYYRRTRLAAIDGWY